MPASSQTKVENTSKNTCFSGETVNEMSKFLYYLKIIGYWSAGAIFLTLLAYLLLVLYNRFKSGDKGNDLYHSINKENQIKGSKESIVKSQKTEEIEFLPNILGTIRPPSRPQALPPGFESPPPKIVSPPVIGEMPAHSHFPSSSVGHSPGAFQNTIIPVRSSISSSPGNPYKASSPLISNSAPKVPRLLQPPVRKISISQQQRPSAAASNRFDASSPLHRHSISNHICKQPAPFPAAIPGRPMSMQPNVFMDNANAINAQRRASLSMFASADVMNVQRRASVSNSVVLNAANAQRRLSMSNPAAIHMNMVNGQQRASMQRSSISNTGNENAMNMMNLPLSAFMQGLSVPNPGNAMNMMNSQQNKSIQRVSVPNPGYIL